MNFNASRNVSQGSGLRKAKRVSDVAAMGAPSPTPGYNQPPPGYNPGFAPASPQPPFHQEGIQLEGNQGFGSPSPPPGDYGFMSGGFPQAPLASPTQIGAMLQQPVVQDMALQYGNQLAAQGRDLVAREVGRYVPVSRLRYYFAVDTRYVLKKLMLISFPFTHKEWMVKYDQQSPVQPRYELNALDLYIPTMGYVTYILLAGFMLGLQHMFSPEQIGLLASSALAYLALELVVHALSRAAAGVTSLSVTDLVAAAGYKFVAMVTALLAATLVGKTGYYVVLGYCSLALAYFLVKTLRMQVLAGAQATEQPPSYSYGAYSPPAYPTSGSSGNKRRLYFLLSVAVTQPLLAWWLTYHLVPNSPVLAVVDAMAAAP